MRPSTTALAAALLVAAGAATFWLAGSVGEATVRQVHEVLADPAAHRHGSFTLVGVPEPGLVPLTGPNGTVLAANPATLPSIRTTSAWSRDGQDYYSTLTVEAATDGEGLAWTVRNETRRQPTDRDTAFPASTSTFRLGRPGQAFPVVGFAAGGAPAPALWAWMERAPESPLQPKPSQFTGHLLFALPDGKPLPSGVLLWKVDSYTAGCSSKFLPPEAAAQHNLTA